MTAFGFFLVGEDLSPAEILEQAAAQQPSLDAGLPALRG